MTVCGHDMLAIHALIDGELDASNAAAVEARIAACPECAAEEAHVLSLRDTLHLPGAHVGAPATLLRRLRGGAAGPAASASPVGAIGVARAPRRPRGLLSRRPWILPVGLAGGASIIGAVALSIMLATPAPLEVSVPGDLVGDHIRSLQADHLVDVETSNRHVVKPWFNGKLDFSPPVVDLKPQGFPLAGGRLDYLDHRAVAAIVYRRGGHVINLFVGPEKGQTASGPVVSRDGYTLRHWRADGMGFWAVSDVNPQDLATFETALKSKLGPAPAPPPEPESENDQD